MALSPDGGQLAFGTVEGLGVMPVKGGPMRQLAAMPVSDETGRRNSRITAEGGPAEDLGIRASHRV